MHRSHAGSIAAYSTVAHPPTQNLYKILNICIIYQYICIKYIRQYVIQAGTLVLINPATRENYSCLRRTHEGPMPGPGGRVLDATSEDLTPLCMHGACTHADLYAHAGALWRLRTTKVPQASKEAVRAARSAAPWRWPTTSTTPLRSSWSAYIDDATKESEAVQATPTMQVLLRQQHHMSFDTDEANDAGWRSWCPSSVVPAHRLTRPRITPTSATPTRWRRRQIAVSRLWSAFVRGTYIRIFIKYE